MMMMMMMTMMIICSARSYKPVVKTNQGVVFYPWDMVYSLLLMHGVYSMASLVHVRIIPDFGNTNSSLHYFIQFRFIKQLRMPCFVMLKFHSHFL